ncbi:MAG: hypothetical protein RRA45_04970 [Saccharolobus sp.]|jgi:hypothetical protein|uniref:hypothetical protein n=1 Tax=Saccharolobus sp. TaxID=2100761 RepID=UPI0028CE9564|nr:hypothetical protein [Saccharolobus sp.]MDT7861544.1 hypothetical protein [Saccharolobus sp.]
MVNVEVYLNVRSLKESLRNFTVEDEVNGWTIVKNKNNEKYIVRDFDESYSILIYVEGLEDDIFQAFSNELSSIKKLKEVLYVPERWNDRIDLKIESNKLMTTPSLDLECITGIELLNSIIKSKGFRYEKIDECLVIIEIEITRPLSSILLDGYINLLYHSLKMYYKIKKAQEDVLLKTALEYMKSI